jgi:signal transduction histidine kinase
MSDPAAAAPQLFNSLSARLLMLTISFIMLAEVLIFVPLISRFRLVYLEEKLAAGELASLALDATPDNMVSEELARDLLRHAGARLVVRKGPKSRRLVLGDYMPSEIEASFDLRNTSPPVLIVDAFMALWPASNRLIRLIGASKERANTIIEVVIDEGPLVARMYDYSVRIMTLSLVISLITGALVFLSLHLLMVRPMRRVTASMVAFRRNPWDPGSILAESTRGDEIGVARRELAAMQGELRAALGQQERLARLGTAVSKVSHDLRNILATAQLVSDRIADSEDPAVRRVTPTLINAIDRAVDLCSHTLRFVQPADAPLRLMTFDLSDLADDLSGSLGLPPNGSIVWLNDIEPGFEIEADRDEIYRLLLNLARNGVQAMQAQRMRVERTDAEAADVIDRLTMTARRASAGDDRRHCGGEGQQEEELDQIEAAAGERAAWRVAAEHVGVGEKINAVGHRVADKEIGHGRGGEIDHDLDQGVDLIFFAHRADFEEKRSLRASIKRVSRRSAQKRHRRPI